MRVLIAGAGIAGAIPWVADLTFAREFRDDLALPVYSIPGLEIGVPEGRRLKAGGRQDCLPHLTHR